jgi:hypothetical protein
MKKTVHLLVLSLFVGASLCAEEPVLQPIFNGKDFTGWDVPEGNVEWFTANDGILKVKNGPKKTGQILWTSEKYSDFVIEFEFKMGEGTVDSGIFIRNDKEQIQIGISGSLKRDMTGSPYIPGKGYPLEAEGVKELLKLKDWNLMKISAVGGQYQVWLNGKQVLDFTSDSAVKEGPIGIQLHAGKDMEIDYRSLKAARL